MKDQLKKLAKEKYNLSGIVYIFDNGNIFTNEDFAGAGLCQHSTNGPAQFQHKFRIDNPFTDCAANTVSAEKARHAIQESSLLRGFVGGLIEVGARNLHANPHIDDRGLHDTDQGIGW